MSVVDLSFIKPASQDDQSSPPVALVSSSKLEQTISLDKPRPFIRTLIAGKRWYLYLKKQTGSKRYGLMNFYSEAELLGMLVVCLEMEDDIRLYTAFTDYLEFYHYAEQFGSKGRCFHEVILGDADQKLRFDIDISEVSDIPRTSQETLDELISAILAEFSTLNIQLSLERHILLFDSSGPDKGSFHLIIDGYKHSNHSEAKVLATRIIERMTQHKQFVDGQIYSSRHNLRIVGSHKQGTNRVKRWLSTFQYRDQAIEHKWDETVDEKTLDLTILSHSLVTSASTCEMLPILVKETKPIIKRTNLPDDAVKKALDIFYQMQGETKALTLTGVEGSMIILRCLQPYRCLKCSKRHESENPFLTVSDKGGIYYHCRRNPGSIHLGWILGGVDTVSTQDEDEDDGVFVWTRPETPVVPVTPVIPVTPVLPNVPLMSTESILSEMSKERPIFDPLKQSTKDQGAEENSLVNLADLLSW